MNVCGEIDTKVRVIDLVICEHVCCRFSLDQRSWIEDQRSRSRRGEGSGAWWTRTKKARRSLMSRCTAGRGSTRPLNRFSKKQRQPEVRVQLLFACCMCSRVVEVRFANQKKGLVQKPPADARSFYISDRKLREEVCLHWDRVYITALCHRSHKNADPSSA